MGIIHNNAIALLKAKKKGTSFKKVLLIGRQQLFITPKKIKLLSEQFSINTSNFSYEYGGYSEEFFKYFLDSEIVDSLDYDDFDGSNIIHDLNFPISSEYYENYDVVIDGGTLEHVFNFPIAVGNCMNFVKKNGSLFVFNMANNHMGHGFYQFSPELYFRLFESNGFITKDIILDVHNYSGAELGPTGKCYSVTDPKEYGGRISLVSKKPVMIMAHGVRKEIIEILSSYPIQSDYEADTGSTYIDRSRVSENNNNWNIRDFAKSLIDFLPRNLKEHIYGLNQLKNNSIKNKKFFTRWK